MSDVQEGADAIWLNTFEFFLKYRHDKDPQLRAEALASPRCLELARQDRAYKLEMEEIRFEQDEYNDGRGAPGDYPSVARELEYGGRLWAIRNPRGSRPPRGDGHGRGGNPRDDRPTRGGGRNPGQGRRHDPGFPGLDPDASLFGGYGGGAGLHGGRAFGGNGRAPRNGGDMRAPSRASSAQHPRGRDPSRQGRREGPRGNGRRELAPPQSRHELREEDDEEDDFDD